MASDENRKRKEVMETEIKKRARKGKQKILDATEYFNSIVGLKFIPEDYPVITALLKLKVSNPFFSTFLVKEVDFYNYPPWSLHRSYKVQKTDGKSYFFVHRERKNPTREAPGGVWKPHGPYIRIKNEDSEDVGGSMKVLGFYKHKNPTKRPGWLMKEYRIDEIKPGSSAGTNVWVICKLFKSFNWTEEDDEEEVEVGEGKKEEEGDQGLDGTVTDGEWLGLLSPVGAMS